MVVLGSREQMCIHHLCGHIIEKNVLMFSSVERAGSSYSPLVGHNAHREKCVRQHSENHNGGQRHPQSKA